MTGPKVMCCMCGNECGIYSPACEACRKAFKFDDLDTWARIDAPAPEDFGMSPIEESPPPLSADFAKQFPQPAAYKYRRYTVESTGVNWRWQIVFVEDFPQEYGNQLEAEPLYSADTVAQLVTRLEKLHAALALAENKPNIDNESCLQPPLTTEDRYTGDQGFSRPMLIIMFGAGILIASAILILLGQIG